MDPQGVSQDARQAGAWDELALHLQSLRRSAGEPSYAEIARRVSQHRLSLGATADAARVARTTIYDTFRAGRTRVDLRLVREIASSLGADDATVDGWLEVSEPTIDPEVPAPARVTPARLHVMALMLGCVAVSLAGRVVVDVLHLPIYLDMTGTAIAAIALGPWRGAAVGGVTNVVGVAVGSGPVSLAFAVVNIAGGLVWGYGVRRFDLGRTLPRFLGLNMLVAVTCSAIAVPIIVAYGGSVGQGQDSITESFSSFVRVDLVATALANLLVSIGDKLISGFIALVVISTLPLAMRTGLRLVLAEPPSR